MRSSREVILRGLCEGGLRLGTRLETRRRWMEAMEARLFDGGGWSLARSAGPRGSVAPPACRARRAGRPVWRRRNGRSEERHMRAVVAASRRGGVLHFPGSADVRSADGRNSQVAHCRSKKTTSLPNPRSLVVGVSVLFLVGNYRTKEGRQKITHAPSVLAVGVKLVTSPFSAIFINTIPGILIDRGLRYRPSGRLVYQESC